MNELFPRPTKTAMNELFPRPTKTAVGGLRKFKTKNEKCKVQFFEQFLFSHFWFMIKLLRDRLMVGHRPLEASILVRVQVRQPKNRIECDNETVNPNSY